MSPLTPWLVHPWLLGAGFAAISLPILIHLLNRRRFRVVDWAAMEFLLAAQNKNRRRIRIEDWSLLALRCLAILCVALVVARPFVSSTMPAGLGAARSQEHIVVLDDSLSMQANLGTDTAFDRASRRLSDLCQTLAAEPKDHFLTILRTSQPTKPALDGIKLSTTTGGEVEQAVKALRPSQARTQLSRALEELNARKDADSLASHRIVYLLTDLREADWDEPTTGQLRKLADQVEAIYVVDCATGDDQNLSIVELRPDAPPTAGMPLTLAVRVKNQGTAPVSDVRVRLTAGNSLPMQSTIRRLEAQETTTVSFQVPLREASSDSSEGASILTLQAELAAAGSSDDRLVPDNIAWYASPIRKGVRVLLVDGGTRADESRSQSFYLRRALAPQGLISSGILVEVASEEQLENAVLDDFEVVFLLNTSGLGERTAEVEARLEKWVRSGGSLVILPGDMTDPATFNALFWKNGSGLSPLRLERIHGDERRESWVQLQMEDANHDLTQHFAGPNNPLLASLKIFRWWQAAPSDTAGKMQILARLTNAEHSPAIVHASLDRGQVVTGCFPADSVWSNWPAEPSYVLFMQDLVRWLSSRRDSLRSLTVGDAIQTTGDITRYDNHATLIDPAGLASVLQSAPPSDAFVGDSTQWRLRSFPTEAAGIYRLTLKKRSGGDDTQAFAVNVDPAEGDLRRIASEMFRALPSSKIKLLEGEADLFASVAGKKSELWQLLLLAAGAFLLAEQTLAWHLGRVRT